MIGLLVAESEIQSLEGNIVMPFENDELSRELGIEPKRGVIRNRLIRAREHETGERGERGSCRARLSSKLDRTVIVDLHQYLEDAQG